MLSWLGKNMQIFNLETSVEQLDEHRSWLEQACQESAFLTGFFFSYINFHYFLEGCTSIFFLSNCHKIFFFLKEGRSFKLGAEKRSVKRVTLP